MNKKLYLNLIFLIAGSFIVLTMGSIVTVNFFKDSRIFGRQDVTASSGTTPASKSTQSSKTSQSMGTNKKPETINYQREVIVNRPKVDAGEDISNPKTTETATPTPSPTVSPTQNPMRFKVEVINRTGGAHVAETVRKLLESDGFEVSAGNGPSDKPVMTEIIDRNDKNAGAEVKKTLRIGKLSKAVDPNSRYDVTVIIGDDYLP